MLQLTSLSQTTLHQEVYLLFDIYLVQLNSSQEPVSLEFSEVKKKKKNYDVRLSEYLTIKNCFCLQAFLETASDLTQITENLSAVSYDISV